MKTLIKILCLSVLWISCESSTEPEDVYGCTDETACNYNIDATEDNETCIYPEDGCDCNDVCPHLIFNRICITPDESEMIEIYNPLNESVDLSNYYLSDNNKYFQWINGESIGNFDFLVKFPSGTTIQSEETYIVTTQTSEVFFNYYGYEPNLSILDENLEVIEYGVNPNLSDSEEMLVLFYWDGTTSIVQDVDYFLWGDYDKGFSKTTEEGYPYNDTLLEDQIFIRNYGLSDFHDSLYVRLDSNEYDEIQSNGNGITGHDETSENFNLSWSIQEKEMSFSDIINGDYDCAGNSQDACPLGSLDCPIVNPSGMIVDYFDITQFGGPHAITIEDSDGYRLELTIWPDNWDIANDPEYSYLLEPPYNRYFVQAFGNVFEYQGEKQILVCDVDDFTIITETEVSGGCTDINACNYDENANSDNGSCEYVIDCFGQCGGDAIIDECGECGGNGLSCEAYLAVNAQMANFTGCSSCNTVTGYESGDLLISCYECQEITFDYSVENIGEETAYNSQIRFKVIYTPFTNLNLPEETWYSDMVNLGTINPSNSESGLIQAVEDSDIATYLSVRVYLENISYFD